jgi:hypothetical protein
MNIIVKTFEWIKGIVLPTPKPPIRYGGWHFCYECGQIVMNGTPHTCTKRKP